MRAEHNCHLCKYESLCRCFGAKHHGMDVSISGNRETNKKDNVSGDLPICDEYEYGGTAEHLKEIEEAEKLGVTELNGQIRIEEEAHFYGIETEKVKEFAKQKELSGYKTEITNCNHNGFVVKSSIWLLV